jgi:hypothetical protein
LDEKDIKMMVRSKINIRIFITFLIPLKLKANYTIKSLQNEYQYQGIHKSKFEKCRNEVDPLKGEDSFKWYIQGSEKVNFRVPGVNNIIKKVTCIYIQRCCSPVS